MRSTRAIVPLTTNSHAKFLHRSLNHDQSALQALKTYSGSFHCRNIVIQTLNGFGVEKVSLIMRPAELQISANQITSSEYTPKLIS